MLTNIGSKDPRKTPTHNICPTSRLPASLATRPAAGPESSPPSTVRSEYPAQSTEYGADGIDVASLLVVNALLAPPPHATLHIVP